MVSSRALIVARCSSTSFCSSSSVKGRAGESPSMAAPPAAPAPWAAGCVWAGAELVSEPSWGGGSSANAEGARPRSAPKSSPQRRVLTAGTTRSPTAHGTRAIGGSAAFRAALYQSLLLRGRILLEHLGDHFLHLLLDLV